MSNHDTYYGQLSVEAITRLRKPTWYYGLRLQLWARTQIRNGLHTKEQQLFANSII